MSFSYRTLIDNAWVYWIKTLNTASGIPVTNKSCSGEFCVSAEQRGADPVHDLLWEVSSQEHLPVAREVCKNQDTCQELVSHWIDKSPKPGISSSQQSTLLERKAQDELVVLRVQLLPTSLGQHLNSSAFCYTAVWSQPQAVVGLCSDIVLLLIFPEILHEDNFCAKIQAWAVKWR